MKNWIQTILKTNFRSICIIWWKVLD